MTPQIPTTEWTELDDESWYVLNRAVFRFEDAWNRHGFPDIAAFVPNSNAMLLEHVLVELIKVDQEKRWRRGVHRPLEAYLSDWPELYVREAALVELISAECLTRSIYEKAPSFCELRSRFPSVCEKVPLARIREEATYETNHKAPAARSVPAPPSWQSEVLCDGLTAALPQHYEIRETLFHWGNGIVYKAYDREEACEVAVGVCYCEPTGEPLASRLFRREAERFATRCDCNHTAIYDFGKVSNVCYLVASLDSIGMRDDHQRVIRSRQTLEPTMSLLQEKEVIRGTYEVERLLGEGAFAEVYRVKHRFLGRQAMKVFKMVGMTIEETEEMLGEALVLSRIGHPNIVRVFDANITGTSRGISGFFTMEYVAGGSLDRGDRMETGSCQSR
jgi:hypothetical protein